MPEPSDSPSLISVIIPVYNIQKYLRRCLDSVLAQTYKNLEIIIIDDGSTDDTGKICDEYATKDSRIKVVHQSHQELNHTRNKGLQLAQGKYITTVDGDDYIEPDTYEYLWKLISKENADVAMCNVYEGDGFKSKKPIKADYQLIPVTEMTKFSDWMFLWNKLFSMQAISKLQFNPKSAIRSDELFMFEVIKQTHLKVALGNERKYHYCQIPGSNTYRFKPIYLDAVAQLENYLKQAKELQMTDIYPARYYALLNLISSWLFMLANSKEPEPQYVQAVLKHLKRHFFSFLFTKSISAKKKLFVLMCFVHFNTARKIVKTYNKHKSN